MSRIVFPQVSMQLVDGDGMPNNIKENEPWDADHPLVRRYPQYFAELPTRLMPHGNPPRVEAATAAPGERRGQ